MTSHSPKASPTVHVNRWTEQQVIDWLSTVGLTKYAKDFKSNGITGDVLVLLDDEALKDIGVVTIGQRLALLSAIYRLKQQYGIPIQEGDWIPKAVEAQEHASNALTTAHMAGALQQRDDRIRLLESQILRLADYLARFQQDMASVARHVGVKAASTDTPITLVSNSLHTHNPSDGSMNSTSGFGSNSDLAATAASARPLESPSSRTFAGLVSPTRSGFTYPAGHAMSGFKPASVAPRTDSGGGHNSPMTPTTAAHAYAATSSSNGAGPTDLSPTQSTPSATSSSLGSQPGFSQQQPQSSQPPQANNAAATSMVSPTRRLAHQQALSQFDGAGSSRPRAGSLGASNTLTTIGASPFAASTSTSNTNSTGVSTNPANAAASSATEREDRKDATAATSSGPNAKAATATTSSLSAPASASANTASSDSNPYKSFRVTLDDPCYKVLPAALKKYKINDDWRKYALFICYGKTERCLSYDEKPLLLFQKLKENEQSPVFMLRHIRDVKSPIAIAEAKAASKLQERENEGTAAPKKRSPPRADRRRIIAGPPPPGALVTNTSNPVEVGPAADLPERNKVSKTYAVAIYPYMPERDDEFDVNVGDTFIVINKAKGWWIVQRDAKGDGTSDVVYSVPTGEANEAEGTTYSNYRAEYSSGWVPAGCLLETSRPLVSIVDVEGLASHQRSGPNTISNPSTPTASTIPARIDAKRAAIPPALITSTSTPGIMLMDYQSSEGDLELRKDERLRVFKRYNHWSYCVQERDGHARGWVPSWYIGKLSSSSSSSSGGVANSSSGSGAVAKSPSSHALSSIAGNASSSDSRLMQQNAEGVGIAGATNGSPAYDTAHDHSSAAAIASM